MDIINFTDVVLLVNAICRCNIAQCIVFPHITTMYMHPIATNRVVANGPFFASSCMFTSCELFLPLDLMTRSVPLHVCQGHHCGSQHYQTHQLCPESGCAVRLRTVDARTRFTRGPDMFLSSTSSTICTSTTRPWSHSQTSFCSHAFTAWLL